MTKPFEMTAESWIGALSDAWWQGHRDVCNDCNCRADSNPYYRRREAITAGTERACMLCRRYGHDEDGCPSNPLNWSSPV